MAQRPVAAGRVADAPQPSPDRPRSGKSHLALALWPGAGALARQLRPTWRPAGESAAARLVSRAFCCRWLVDQVAAPSPHALGNLSDEHGPGCGWGAG